MLLLALALAAAPLGGALPEGNAYVRALVDRHRQREDAADSYAYDVVEQREELDGRGRARKVERRRYQVFHVRGRAVRTLVEEDGAALPPERARREVAEARAQADAIGTGRVAVERSAVRLSEVLERCDFRTVAREDVDGRPALVLEFAPRAGATAREESRRDRLLRRLAGRIWIDEGR